MATRGGGGDEYVVVPEGWLSRGEAFVRGDGQQLVVFGGIPGERAKVRVVERSQHQARARFVKAAGPPSPDRVHPPCERYAPCGRCPLMHLSEVGQDRARIAVLRDAFTDAKLALPEGRGVDGVVHTPDLRQHAVELAAGWTDDRHLRIGVPARDGRKLVAIPQCTVATEALRTLMIATAHHARVLEVWPWEGGRGSLRGFFARQSSTTGEVLVTFVFARSSPFAKQLAEAVASQQAEVVGAFAHWNDVQGPIVGFNPDTGDADASLVYGRPTIEEDVDGLRIRIGALDPFPAFPRAGVRLWTALRDALAPAQGDAVVDLGAGAGSGARTLLLARASGWALGIDPREGVVRRARENAATNGIGADFTVGNLGYGLEDAAPRLVGRRPLIVADPGFKGLDQPTFDAIVALDPRRVALLSTNPRNLARDAAKLAARGLRLTRVVPVDTVPHTPFGDTIAILESPDATPPTMRAPRRKTIR